MPISNLVESAVNLAEKVTGRDIDGDGDVGVAGNVSAKEQLDDAKERKNLATELPIFDKTTPKVSVLNIGMMTLESAKKLVDDAVQQTDEFEDQAKQKAAFAYVAYTTKNPDTQVNKCILKNGTGVRLVVRKPDSSGLDPYQPPAILEPGENAFFLCESSEKIGEDKKAGLSLTMNIQVFQGPMGWLPDDNPQEDVTVAEGKTGGRPTKTISTFVDVGGGTKYPTEIDFDVGGGVPDNEDNDLFVITVTQTIRA